MDKYEGIAYELAMKRLAPLLGQDIEKTAAPALMFSAAARIERLQALLDAQAQALAVFPAGAVVRVVPVFQGKEYRVGYETAGGAVRYVPGVGNYGDFTEKLIDAAAAFELYQAQAEDNQQEVTNGK